MISKGMAFSPGRLSDISKPLEPSLDLLCLLLCKSLPWSLATLMGIRVPDLFSSPDLFLEGLLEHSSVHVLGNRGIQKCQKARGDISHVGFGQGAFFHPFSPEKENSVHSMPA